MPSLRLVLGCVLALSLGTLALGSWTPASFPNPKKDVAACGRGVPSNICDPDALLTKAEADRVEGVVKDIRGGVDPFKRRKCGDDLEGYMVRIWCGRGLRGVFRVGLCLCMQWCLGAAVLPNEWVLLMHAARSSTFYFASSNTVSSLQPPRWRWRSCSP